MKSWNGSVKSSVRAIARSTWASPRTSRRTRIPASRRSSSDRGTVHLRRCSRMASVVAAGRLDVHEVGRPFDDFDVGVGHRGGHLSADRCRRRGIVTPGEQQCRCHHRSEGSGADPSPRWLRSKPAYPSAGVAASMSRTSCAISGARSRYPHRSTTRSDTALGPPARTRSRAIVPGQRAQVGTATTHAATSRSDALGASRRSSAPPSRRATGHRAEARSIAARPGGAITSPARSPIVYGPCGTGERPWPRRSIERTRKSRDSTGIWGAHIRVDVPIAWMSTTTGASTGPSNSWWSATVLTGFGLRVARRGSCRPRPAASPTSTAAWLARFRAMASGRTTRCPRQSPSQAAAESVVISNWRNGIHSACQVRPRARVPGPCEPSRVARARSTDGRR